MFHYFHCQQASLKYAATASNCLEEMYLQLEHSEQGESASIICNDILCMSTALVYSRTLIRPEGEGEVAVFSAKRRDRRSS